MYIKRLTYKDYDGNERTEDLYFNLNETELIELQVSEEGGLDQMLRNIIEAKDNKAIIAEFKKIVMLSYGIKSADGRKFIKNDEVKEDFQYSAAFPALFMELSTNTQEAIKFINNVIPSELDTKSKKLIEEDKLEGQVSLDI